MTCSQTQSDPCTDCLYYRICMERRGICTEYKILEMIRREINALNENQKTVAACSEDNHEARSQ